MKHQNYHNPYMSGKSVINTFAQSLEISYHYGGKHILDSSWWHETDVICPLTKMFYILEGEILIKIDNKEIIATAGEMMIIPAGVKHDYCLTELNHAHKFWVHFDLKINHANLFDHYDFPYKISIGNNPLIFSLFNQLTAIKADETTWQNLTKASILCPSECITTPRAQSLCLFPKTQAMSPSCLWVRSWKRSASLGAQSPSSPTSDDLSEEILDNVLDMYGRKVLAIYRLCKADKHLAVARNVSVFAKHEVTHNKA